MKAAILLASVIITSCASTASSPHVLNWKLTYGDSSDPTDKVQVCSKADSLSAIAERDPQFASTIERLDNIELGKDTIIDFERKTNLRGRKVDNYSYVFKMGVAVDPTISVVAFENEDHSAIAILNVSIGTEVFERCIWEARS